MKITETNLKFNESKLVTLNKQKVLLVVLHHRGGSGNIESIHSQHLKNGWAGIGYHFYIRKDGEVFRGRPIEYVGSHCLGNNSCSIGVCLEGDFKKEQPTEQQLKSTAELYKLIQKRYPKVYKMINHKDVCKTLCPVVDLKNMVKRYL